MLSDLRNQVKKTGQPPGTALYTGKKNTHPRITITNYSAEDFHEITSDNLDTCLAGQRKLATTWIHIEGLRDTALIEKVSELYKLHPLTTEDILNVQQRPKVEEFAGYLYLTLKIILWNPAKKKFTIEQFSCVLGKDFVLTFQEYESSLFKTISERLRSTTTQRMRQQGGDYLVYRFIDAIIDTYFVVLEGLGEQIESVEENIITDPSQQNTKTIYRLKRQMLLLRKAIWPMREVISHLTQVEETFITPFTRVYLRDVYDHTVQAIDTVETFRDMLSGMLDVYLSSLTNRMNEIMKTLTIITTIFIPITSLASIYGMNFYYMPELKYHYGYPIVITVMLSITILMMLYFRKKKWL